MLRCSAATLGYLRQVNALGFSSRALPSSFLSRTLTFVFNQAVRLKNFGMLRCAAATLSEKSRNCADNNKKVNSFVKNMQKKNIFA